tara:strand:- start:365 stop:721 length:357 start_codon:yes stop_codon:yes gene_type:complete
MIDLFLKEPVGFLNGYTSLIRNMFLISSIGILTLGFKNHVKNKHKVFFNIFALSIFVFSIIYGFKASFDFNMYINEVKKDKEMVNSYKKYIKNWILWIYLSYGYMVLLLIFSLLIILV